MRLFIGVIIPDGVKKELGERAEKGREIPGIRWIPSASVHITLKFLGSVMKDKLDQIKEQLKTAVLEVPSFTVWLEKGGVFPTPALPRIFWVGFQGEIHRLKELVERIETNFIPLGFPREKKEFRAHLTVGRDSRNFTPRMTSSDQFCTLFSDWKTSQLHVKEVQLIESHLGSSGARYEVLESYPLK